jgi:hypothetical protein
VRRFQLHEMRGLRPPLKTGRPIALSWESVSPQRILPRERFSPLAHRVGSLRRTDSVAIEGIADIRRSLAARRSDANDPLRTSNCGMH